MPPPLKARLVDEAAIQGSNVNDVAVGILADRFGVSYRGTGRRGGAAGASGVVLLRLPPELKIGRAHV